MRSVAAGLLPQHGRGACRAGQPAGWELQRRRPAVLPAQVLYGADLDSAEVGSGFPRAPPLADRRAAVPGRRAGPPSLLPHGDDVCRLILAAREQHWSCSCGDRLQHGFLPRSSYLQYQCLRHRPLEPVRAAPPRRLPQQPAASAGRAHRWCGIKGAAVSLRACRLPASAPYGPGLPLFSCNSVLLLPAQILCLLPSTACRCDGALGVRWHVLLLLLLARGGPHVLFHQLQPLGRAQAVVRQAACWEALLGGAMLLGRALSFPWR